MNSWIASPQLSRGPVSPLPYSHPPRACRHPTHPTTPRMWNEQFAEDSPIGGLKLQAVWNVGSPLWQGPGLGAGDLCRQYRAKAFGSQVVQAWAMWLLRHLHPSMCSQVPVSQSAVPILSPTLETYSSLWSPIKVKHVGI